MIKNKSIIDPMDLSVEEIREIITLAEDMKKRIPILQTRTKHLCLYGICRWTDRCGNDSG